MPRLAKGMVSGLWGVVAMTGMGLSIRRWTSEAEGLGKTDPEITVDWICGRMGRDHLPPRARRRRADPIHFLVGSMGGLSYAALTRHRRPPPLLGGLVAAGALWTLGFCGYMPALGILPPPWKWSGHKLLTTAAAHTAYGCTMAMVFAGLDRPGEPDRTGQANRG